MKYIIRYFIPINMEVKQKIYLDMEANFIYDYIFFSAHLRFLKAQGNTYRSYTKNQVARAMCLVNLFETYQQSLEDLAVVTLAVQRRYNSAAECRYQRDFSIIETPLVYTMIHYKPGDANLEDIIASFANDSDLTRGLGLVNIEEINLTFLYPDIDFRKFYDFFLVGFKSLAEDQDKRLKMFNKIKHGGIVISDGHIFSSTLPKHTPAAIYADPAAFNPNDHPLLIHGFKYADEEFELMKAGVMKISTMIKIMCSIYLCKEYMGKKMVDGYTISIDLFNRIQGKKYLKMWDGY